MHVIQSLATGARRQFRHRSSLINLKASMSTVSRARVVVLYQSLDPPVIDGIQKPKKPGGSKICPFFVKFTVFA